MKKRIYVRVGLGIAAVAGFILLTYLAGPLFSRSTFPEILWNYRSGIAWAYVIVWIFGSALVANGFFFSLLSASMDARNWRVMLVVTLLTFLIVVPITPVVILLIVNVMFNEPITPIMVKVMGIGAPVYIVVLCLVYLWFPWRQNFRLLVNGWGRWRVGLFGVLSCSYMGFLTWLGMFLYLGIMKQ